MPNGKITVPDFKGSTLTEANRSAQEMNLLLTYYDSSGYPVLAPVQSQWPNWKVLQNMPPTTSGFQIMPGGQVGVMITFVPGN